MKSGDTFHSVIFSNDPMLPPLARLHHPYATVEQIGEAVEQRRRWCDTYQAAAPGGSANNCGLTYEVDTTDDGKVGKIACIGCVDGVTACQNPLAVLEVMERLEKQGGERF